MKGMKKAPVKVAKTMVKDKKSVAPNYMAKDGKPMSAGKSPIGKKK
jgi:hypothetical protein